MQREIKKGGVTNDTLNIAVNTLNYLPKDCLNTEGEKDKQLES